MLIHAIVRLLLKTVFWNIHFNMKNVEMWIMDVEMYIQLTFFSTLNSDRVHLANEAVWNYKLALIHIFDFYSNWHCAACQKLLVQTHWEVTLHL